MVFLYPKIGKDKDVQGELQEQITRCKDMQSKCRIDDIDTFIRLSNRIEELTGKIDKTEKQLVVPVQNDENKIEMF